MKIFPTTLAWPTTEPVTLEQLRAEVRADDQSEDAVLMGSLMAARDVVEGMLGGRIVPRTVRATFEAWPGLSDTLTIGVRVQSIDALAYTDITQTQVPWAAGLWVARTSIGVTKVRPAWGQAWPVLGNDPVITLDATEGYTTTPEAIVKAILMVAAHFHVNREATGGGARYVPTEIAFGVRQLLGAHRWVLVG